MFRLPYTCLSKCYSKHFTWLAHWLFFLNYYFSFLLACLQDLSSTTRDWTQAVRVLSPNHWATKEFPLNCFLIFKIVFLLTLLRYDWQIKIVSIKAVWCDFFQRCTTWWFNICCEMITIIKIINISITSHCDHFVCVCHENTKDLFSYQISSIQDKYC